MPTWYYIPSLYLSLLRCLLFIHLSSLVCCSSYVPNEVDVREVLVTDTELEDDVGHLRQGALDVLERMGGGRKN